MQAEQSSEKCDYSLLSWIKADIEEIGVNILRRSGLKTEHIRLTPPLKFFGITVSGEPTGISVPIPELLYKDYFLTRRYRCFLKSVMEEIAIPSKLGEMKDKLDRFISPKGSF